MNLSLSLLFVIFSALCIHLDLAAVANKQVGKKSEDLGPTEDMLRLEARKTKNGWLCAGVICPNPRTTSCKTTSILKPTAKLEHDLLVACIDVNDKVFCGVTRSSRVEVREVLEMGDDGQMEYRNKETIATTLGKSIPRCYKKQTEK